MNRLGKDIMQSVFNGPYWCVDYIEVSDDRLEIRGWAISDNTDPSINSFSFNGREFDEIEYPKERPDIENIFWFIEDSRKTGFICKSKVSKDELFKDGNITLSHINKETQKPFKSSQNYYYSDNISELPFPSTANRMRVHGGESAPSFNLEGSSTYTKCNEALKKATGKSYDDFKHLLDWGCGCGRMTRYFHSNKGLELTGVDIDADNIQWCRNHLPFGQFREIPLHPATDLPSDHYDLLIGISIFTHLKEQEQFEWLHELKRISTKGAILLMTVHGNAAACRCGVDTGIISKWKQDGFVDLGANGDLGSAISDSDYYRNTLHTEAYIHERWSEIFEIIDIIPAYIGNHQDLVIMRA